MPPTVPHDDSDPFDLERFLLAQQGDYSRALDELRAGRKQTHWMWYIFPQLRGLGSSAISQRYAIGSLAEAKAYLAHPVLGSRLRECATTILAHKKLSASEIFGFPDDLKLRSSATLFARASDGAFPFRQVLLQFFDGREDETTLQLLGVPT